MSTKKSSTKKKATPNSKSSKKESPQPKSQTNKQSEKTSDVATQLKENKLWLIAALVIALALGAYAFRGQFIVATVNGQPILRSEYIQAMENRVGESTLDQLVIEELVRQEAAQQNITANQADIDAQLASLSATLQAQGQSLEQALAAQGLNINDYSDQLRIQSLIDQLIGDQVAVTQEEVDEYIQLNQAQLPDLEEAELQELARQQLERQASTQRINQWLQQLQESATVSYW